MTEPSSDSKTPISHVVRWIGLGAAPTLALIVWVLLPDETPLANLEEGAVALSSEARATAAVGILMAVLWMTEALPLAVTALLPIILFPLVGVYRATPGSPSPIRLATAPYAHELIFLFMGGFLIALAIERWNLHRRIALLTLLRVGTRPTQLIAGFMLATAGLSMWISNTACTVMMLPIGLSVARLVAQHHAKQDSPPPKSEIESFSTCLMLSIAYAASIGGVGTLIGTPPNVFLAGYLAETHGIVIGFGRWLLVGLPLVAVFLTIAWLILTRVAFRIRLPEIPGGRQIIRDHLDQLGPISRGERSVACVFLVTACLWIAREPLSHWEGFVEVFPAWTALSDTGIALIGALTLFILPIDAKNRVFALDWETATRLPWGVLILFGGGLSLATAVNKSGLALWISQGLPTDVSPLLLVIVSAGLVVYLTELTSNIATANIFLPILGGIAIVHGIDPLLLVVPAALAASCAFMLPVATPPNAIVFGSGEIRLASMIRAGFWLNIVSVILIPLVTFTLLRWVFGI